MVNEKIDAGPFEGRTTQKTRLFLDLASDWVPKSFVSRLSRAWLGTSNVTHQERFFPDWEVVGQCPYTAEKGRKSPYTVEKVGFCMHERWTLYVQCRARRLMHNSWRKYTGCAFPLDLRFSHFYWSKLPSILVGVERSLFGDHMIFTSSKLLDRGTIPWHFVSEWTLTCERVKQMFDLMR